MRREKGRGSRPTLTTFPFSRTIEYFVNVLWTTERDLEVVVEWFKINHKWREHHSCDGRLATGALIPAVWPWTRLNLFFFLMWKMRIICVFYLVWFMWGSHEIMYVKCFANSNSHSRLKSCLVLVCSNPFQSWSKMYIFSAYTGLTWNKIMFELFKGSLIFLHFILAEVTVLFYT